MNLKGKIQGRGTKGQGYDFSLRGENINFFWNEVCFQAFQEFSGALLLFVKIDHFSQPIQPFVLFHDVAGICFLIFPMGGDSVLS